MEQSPGLKLIYILMNDRDFMRVTCDQVGGCDGIVVNSPPHWLYIAFSLLSRLWVQICYDSKLKGLSNETTLVLE